MSQMWIAPFLASLPPWWRLLQCFRRYRDSNETVHLLNAAKYTSSILAAIVTGLRRMYRKYTLNHIYNASCSLKKLYFSFHCNDRILDIVKFIKFLLYLYLGYQDGLGITSSKYRKLFIKR